MKSAIYVFIAGCSYGMLATLVKLAYGRGFEVSEVVGAQYYFGLFILSTIVLFMPKIKLELKKIFSLLLVGVVTGLTGIFYSSSLSLISATLGVVLLFQFTWIGVLIEAIAEKTFPSRAKMVSVIFIFIGTLMAGGILGASNIEFNALGVFLGFLSGISFAVFIFLASRVAVEVPALTRTFWIALGAVCIITVFYPPKFLINGALTSGLFKYGLLLGIFGPAIAPLLFAKGAPITGSGLATVLGSSELPVAILMSSLLLKEQVSIIQWFGIFIILFAIALPYLFALIKERYLANHKNTPSAS